MQVNWLIGHQEVGEPCVLTKKTITQSFKIQSVK